MGHHAGGIRGCPLFGNPPGFTLPGRDHKLDDLTEVHLIPLPGRIFNEVHATGRRARQEIQITIQITIHIHIHISQSRRGGAQEFHYNSLPSRLKFDRNFKFRRTRKKRDEG